MPLPPLANFVAVHEPPGRREARRAALHHDPQLDVVADGPHGWLVGVGHLPGPIVDASVLSIAGMVFAEGFLPERSTALADEASEPAGDSTWARLLPGGEADVVRSVAGLAPVYVHRADGSTVLATSSSLMARHMATVPALDALPHVLWSTRAMVIPRGRSYLANVSLVPAAHRARLRSGRPLQTQPYWEPPPAPERPPDEEVVRHHRTWLRQTLLHVLEQGLDGSGRNLLSLSGGVDSSSLAALAAGVLGFGVSTLSLIPSHSALGRDEEAHIRTLASLVGIQHAHFIRWAPGQARELLRAAPRVIAPVPHPILCSMAPHADQVDVLFGGEFADTLCGSAATMPDWASATRLIDLPGHLRRLPLGWKDPLRWARYRWHGARGHPAVPYTLTLPNVFNMDLQAEYLQWRETFEARQEMGPRGQYHMQVLNDAWVTMNWEACSAHRVRRLLPFFNRTTIEMGYQLHPHELVGPGTKKLLRAALSEDVPRSHLHRTDKGLWGRSVTLPASLPFIDEIPVPIEGWLRPDLDLDHLTYHEFTTLQRLVVSHEGVEEAARFRYRSTL